MFGRFSTKSESTARALTPPRRHALSAASESADQVEVRAPIIGVLGSKGGVGATTTAINLTAALSSVAGSATMIDANLHHPDAAVLVGKQVKYGLLELLERAHELDPSVISACAVPMSEVLQCRLISAPATGEAGVKAQVSELANCLPALRACSPAWVIDLPKHLDKHLVTVMDKCDRVLLVLEPTLCAVSAAERWQSVFDELGYDANKTSWLLNRCGGRVKVVESQLNDMDRSCQFIRVPNAFELLETAVSRCEPAFVVNGRAPYSVALKKLAQSLMEEPA